MLATLDSPPPIMAAKMSEDSSFIRDRAALRSLKEALGAFRDLNVRMPVGVPIMFLTVALNEGENGNFLADKAGIKRSSASRYLLDLSDKTRAGDEGYNLVTGETDTSGDMRAKVYSLTPRGRTLIRKMISDSAKGNLSGDNS